MSAKSSFTFKHFKFPLFPLLTHSAMNVLKVYAISQGEFGLKFFFSQLWVGVTSGTQYVVLCPLTIWQNELGVRVTSEIHYCSIIMGTCSGTGRG